MVYLYVRVLRLRVARSPNQADHLGPLKIYSISNNSAGRLLRGPLDQKSPAESATGAGGAFAGVCAPAFPFNLPPNV
jgi:hypothetical protein